MNKSLFTTTATVIALGLAATAAPVFAQGTNTSGNSGAQSGYSQSNAGSTHVSQAQVQKFAKAQKDMQSLVRNSQQKIKNADNKKQARQYRQQMNKQIVQTIKKEGLSVQQYNKIAQATRNNHKLQQRIQKAMQG
ncbi:DUF4168 domain-containing protein [Salinisphaera sp. RV14]|uniref:DUF4168 domain-containing protein n=1 Tax=Salinisphaera sp. RV14 TaxID=3454140 RepID=UPI003F84A10A